MFTGGNKRKRNYNPASYDRITIFLLVLKGKTRLFKTDGT
jgi:hypothetical protein